jgi:hypothetical protein
MFKKRLQVLITSLFVTGLANLKAEDLWNVAVYNSSENVFTIWYPKHNIFNRFSTE